MNFFPRPYLFLIFAVVPLSLVQVGKSAFAWKIPNGIGNVIGDVRRYNAVPRKIGCG